MHYVPEFLSTVVISYLFVVAWTFYVAHSVDMRQNDDFVELCIHGQTNVGQARVVAVLFFAVVLAWAFVVELIVCHCVTLCGIADACAAHIAEGLTIGTLRGFTLSEARIDSAHHLPSNHTDLVEKYQLRRFEVSL